jgi:hypothetical protein
LLDNYPTFPKGKEEYLTIVLNLRLHELVTQMKLLEVFVRRGSEGF